MLEGFDSVVMSEEIRRASIITMHDVTFEDSLIDPFRLPTDHFEHLRITSSQTDIQIDTKAARNTEYWHLCRIDTQKQIIKRNRLDLWEVLSDIGGFHDGLFILTSILLNPFSACFF